MAVCCERFDFWEIFDTQLLCSMPRHESISLESYKRTIFGTLNRCKYKSSVCGNIDNICSTNHILSHNQYDD